MFNHCMIDFETLGTGPDCVVLSLGGVKFNKDSVCDDWFHHMFDVQNQLDAGRTVTADTISWWMGQSDKAREAFSQGGRVQFGAGLVLDSFDRWFKGCEYIWSHGSNFDTVILDNIYTQRRRKVPWSFSNVRDTRTLFSLVGDRGIAKNKDILRGILKPDGITAHQADLDSFNQAKAVQYAWAVLK